MTNRRRFLAGAGAVGAALALPGAPASAARAGAGELAEAFRSPGPRLRPRFTWWWPGPAVDDAELRAEIAEMVAAGFGGAQLFETPGLGLPDDRQPPERFLWGTPHWVARIETVLRAAREHDFRIDFQVSSGWPWNSPAVSGEHAALAQQQLVFGHQEVAGPATFDDVPPRPDDGVDLRDARLVAAVAARLVEPAILDPDSRTDLTQAVDGQGRLRWPVPDGRWVVFGFWQLPTGQRSNGNTSADDPLVLDHLNPEATKAATADLDRRLLSHVGPLAAEVGDRFHEDSPALPFDGLLWTHRFPEEFRARRGYDLTACLPALAVVGYHSFGTGESRQVYDFAGAAGRRIRHDYNQTLTELWVDSHVRPARRWARGHGLDFQGRGHGLTMDVVAVNTAYAAPDADPFDGPVGFTRTITSGGRLAGNEPSRAPAYKEPPLADRAPADRGETEHGRPRQGEIASLELGTMVQRDHMVTLEALKHLADKGFAGGANEQVLHGFPYEHAQGASWPSWWPWSSEHDLVGREFGVSDGFTPAIPWWRHLRPLADYLARTQTVLRAGRPVTDVAVYRDVQGYGRVTDTHVDERGEPLLDVALAGHGYSFDIIDPGTLAERETLGYKALVVELAASKHQGVVDNSDAMPAPVVRRLVSFADDGVPIVFVGGFPSRGVSYRHAEQEDAAVRDSVAELRRSSRVLQVSDEAGVPAALERLGVRPDVSFDRPQQVRGVHRRTATGDYWFLFNTSGALDDTLRLTGGTTARFTASFLAGNRAPDRWDPWTGEVRPIGRFRAAAGRVAVPIELAPGESMVIGFERPIGKAVGSAAEPVALAGELELSAWTLEVEGAVPDGEEHHTLKLERLADWRDIPQLRQTSGTGTYRTTVTVDEHWTTPGRGAWLELGRVEGGVQVRLNGQRVHPACVPPPRIDVGRFLRPGRNTVEIEVTTTLKNRLNALAEQGAAGYSRFLNRPVRTQPYGLVGPVRLVPYAAKGAV